ncbi:Leucine-rich repeat-containing protein 28 [Tupaia chinensis]|uniref:Leucine-rich repeat-containing protein 28 n=1 Tax=Tupaia chinensis TaxID=246437 RepID=L9JBG2_TUPCH|nr:Leucine-rich repeat-containing protein 28 [Tupaia chinensis]
MDGEARGHRQEKGITLHHPEAPRALGELEPVLHLRLASHWPRQEPETRQLRRTAVSFVAYCCSTQCLQTFDLLS